MKKYIKYILLLTITVGISLFTYGCDDKDDKDDKYVPELTKTYESNFII